MTVESTGATFFNATVDAGTGLTTLKSTNNSTGGSLKIQTGGNDRFQISAGGDISFYEDTGTTAKLFWDSSAERLGIGTSSPSAKLDIVSGTGYSDIAIEATGGFKARGDGRVDVGEPTGANSLLSVQRPSGSSITGLAYLNDVNNSTGLQISTSSGAVNLSVIGSSAKLNLGNTGVQTQQVVLDTSSGNVGIGTDSPSTALHVKSTTGVTATIEAGGGGDAVLDIKAAEASGGESVIRFSDSVSGVGFITYAQNDGGSDFMRFGTASTEAMRIDSSQNLLVGKTSTGAATAGIELNGAGDVLRVARDGGAPLEINRITSDGTIVDFRKDNTTVGIISVTSDGPSFGNTTQHVAMHSAKLIPTNASQQSLDATIDLGVSSSRFKDLFLSGTANTGGLDVSGAATITTADNTTQLTLKSTDADATEGPNLDFTRDSASPADDDVLGRIRFLGDNDAGGALTYARIFTTIRDASNGTEDGMLSFNTVSGGANRSRLEFDSTETVFNEGSVDLDFRVESDSNTHMLFVDAGNSRVGIGKSAPDVALHVETGQSNEQFHLQSPTPGMKFIDSNSTSRVFTIGGENGNVAIHADPNTASSDSHIEMKADGSTIARFDGDGLKFGTDTAAANGLDDYEEGTWTPTYGGSTTDGSMTYTSQVGYYTKIGNLVTVNGRVLAGTVTTSPTGAMLIKGLPFTAASDTNNYSGINIAFSNSWANAPLGGHTNPGATFINLKLEDANGNLVSDVSSIANSDDVIFSVTYRAA
jgi:hypothetical protein